jgi:ELWxxDGT repeat protein
MMIADGVPRHNGGENEMKTIKTVALQSLLYADPRLIKRPENQPPVAEAGPNQVLYAGLGGTGVVTLEGANSSDPDGNPLTYSWTWVAGATTYVTNGVSPIISLPPDVYTIQLSDGGDTWEPNIRLSEFSSDVRKAPKEDAERYFLADYQAMVPALKHAERRSIESMQAYFTNRMTSVGLALCLIQSLFGQISIEKPVMVKNINTASAAVNLQPLIEMNGLLFFTTYASTSYNGTDWRGLWKSDGTEAGTVHLQNINLVPNRAFIGYGATPVAKINGTVFFAADDGSSGVELWKSDGTATGTVLVKDIIPGPDGSYPDWLVAIDQTLFFTVGTELWKSDGTAGGTISLKKIDSAQEIRNLVNVNGILFFTAFEPGVADDLWKSDGTAAGTVPVKAEAKNFLEIRELANVNGILFFTALEPATGYELWKTDGTVAGTVLVKDINPRPDGSPPRNLVNVNGTLFFGASASGDDFELWKSDGTEAGTVGVKDIKPGPAGSSPYNLVDANGTLFFNASDRSNSSGLWKSDGTEAGTVRLSTKSFSDWAVANGLLFFTRRDRELWKSDGTVAGTVLVKDMGSLNSTFSGFPLLNVNGTVFFGRGATLWKTDGTPAGTVPVKTIDPALNANAGSNPSGLVNINGFLYFRATDQDGTTSLWRSDGTESGTILMKDEKFWRSAPVQLNGSLFLLEQNAAGIQLLKLDGPEAAPARVKDILPACGGLCPALLAARDGEIFFRVCNSLWRSDGTEAGTRLVKDGFTVCPTSLVNASGALLFMNGHEFWKSDGTEPGTVRVKAFDQRTLLSSLITVNGTVLFVVSVPSPISPNGNWNFVEDELWKSDGTEAGTVLVKKFSLSVEGTYYPVPSLVNLNGTLLLVLNEKELWKSDGTEIGTIQVTNLQTRPFGYISPLVASANGSAFFWAWIDGHDDSATLWKSDGRREGTAPVRHFPSFRRRFLECGDSYPSFGSTTSGLDVGGTLWFFIPGDSAWPDPWTRPELWKSDGTEAGTIRVARFPPHPYCYGFGHGAGDLVNVDGTLFFTADDGINGFELWKFNDRDSDGDGLPDWWEGKFFSGYANPGEDPDGDGLTNWQESRAGTDPTNPNSVLKFADVEKLESGQIRLRWPSVVNQEYVLLRSSVLTDNRQGDGVLARRILATPPMNAYLDASATVGAAYFYQLKLEE